MKLKNPSIESVKQMTFKELGMATDCLNFSHALSCGTCVPCRIGAKRMTELLDRITNGDGSPGDIEALKRLGNYIKISSRCAHGLLIGNIMLTILDTFHDELEYKINCNIM